MHGMQTNPSPSLDSQQTKSPLQSKTILGGMATLVPILIIRLAVVQRHYSP